MTEKYNFPSTEVLVAIDQISDDLDCLGDIVGIATLPIYQQTMRTLQKLRLAARPDWE